MKTIFKVQRIYIIVFFSPDYRLNKHTRALRLGKKVATLDFKRLYL